MRVIHVITTLSRGGAENHLVELIRGQIALGWQVAVAYLRREGYWRPTLEAQGVRVLDLGVSRYCDFRPIVRLRSFIKEMRPDLVHAHMPPAELYSRIALCGCDLPLVISKHNDSDFYEGPGSRLIGSWTAARASQVITISDAVQRTMSAQLAIGCGKLTTIHYGLDTAPLEGAANAEVRAFRAEFGVTDGEMLVGTAARFVRQKGLDTLLRGFARYLAAGGAARLLVLGEGPLEAQLRAAAADLDLGTRAIFAGFRHDVPIFMNAIDVFVLTSRYEGLGLVLLEAMAAAKPVVATRVSAIPEVVRDGETGILVPPDDPGALANALAYLEDTSLRFRMGQAGHKRVQDAFSLRSMIASTTKVYWSAVGRTGSRGGGTEEWSIFPAERGKAGVRNLPKG